MLTRYSFVILTFRLYHQARKLRKYKEKRLDGYHGGPNMGENLADVLNSIEVDDSGAAEDENYIDPEQTVVTKIKRYESFLNVKHGLMDYTMLIVCLLFRSASI